MKGFNDKLHNITLFGLPITTVMLLLSLPLLTSLLVTSVNAVTAALTDSYLNTLFKQAGGGDPVLLLEICVLLVIMFTLLGRIYTMASIGILVFAI